MNQRHWADGQGKALKTEDPWEFPGGPVVRTRRFHCCGRGSIPGQGTKIPQATQHSQKQTSKQTNRGPSTLLNLITSSFLQVLVFSPLSEEAKRDLC